MAERIVFEGELDLEHLNLIKALSAREMYVEELAQIAERDERIVITGADVGAGGKIGEFKEKYPDRFIDTGIAEADQVGVSAGMALNGKIVYLAGFGPFLALRALDQVHTDVAYQNIPVRIVNTHSGLTSGGGPTHYNIMDLAVMRDLPNMTVIAPSDSRSVSKPSAPRWNIPDPSVSASPAAQSLPSIPRRTMTTKSARPSLPSTAPTSPSSPPARSSRCPSLRQTDSPRKAFPSA